MQEKYIWGHERRYNDYTNFFKNKFNQRVQKISVNAGFSCPNRDGTKGTDGCAYCNNRTFNPFYCEPEKPISQQIEEGIAFFSKKYKTQKYLAYFQAFTNTYAPLEVLKKLYNEALQNLNVIGLVIATRPDCISEEVLSYLEELAEKYYIVLEYGVESCSDESLELLNRGHNFEEVVKTLKMTAGRGIHVGVHLILGLPKETKETMLNHAKILSKLPIETIKLHQLQIVKDTPLAKMFEEEPEVFNLYSPEEYIDLAIDFIEILNPEIVVERFTSESPQELLISPQWGGLKNFQIVAKIEKRLKERDTWQGKLY